MIKGSSAGARTEREREPEREGLSDVWLISPAAVSVSPTRPFPGSKQLAFVPAVLTLGQLEDTGQPLKANVILALALDRDGRLLET